MQNIGEQTLAINYLPLGEHRDLVDINNSRTTITDENGVPLESDRRNPPESLDFDYQLCPYSDSPTRYPDGSPSSIPMSGLEHGRLMKSYPRIRRELLATRAAYLSLFGMSDDYELSTQDGINILCAIQGLPTYLTERVKNPVSTQNELPQHLVVAANCASGGIGGIGSFTNGRIYDRIPLDTGATILNAAENEPSGGLVGDKTACAAPPNMIRQFINLLRDGNEVINYGTLEEETDDLLTRSELPNALSVGLNMESVLVYNEVLQQADYELSKLLEKFNPRKHNPRRIRSGLDDFSEALSLFVSGCYNASSSINIALGRAANRPGEFERVVAGNTFCINSIRIAKSKGITIPEPIK
jgi:hypothetical protein